MCIVLIFNTLLPEGLKIPKSSQLWKKPLGEMMISMTLWSHQPGVCVGKAGITQESTRRAQTSQVTAQCSCGPQRWTLSRALPCRNDNLAQPLKALWRCQIAALQQWKSKNNCRELLGMEHRAEIMIASILTSSISEQEGKAEDDIYERQPNTNTLPPAQGSTKLWITANQTSFLGGSCPAPPPLCYWSDIETQYWQKRTSVWPGGSLSLLLPRFFCQSWSLKNCIATSNEGKR